MVDSGLEAGEQGLFIPGSGKTASLASSTPPAMQAR